MPLVTLASPLIPPRWRLFLLSFLMLFLELALIRWLGESILYLSFFSNFVLLASFLGIGLGFLSADRKPLEGWLAPTLLLLVAAVAVFPIGVDRSAADVIFIGSGAPSGLPIWVALPLLFIAVAFLMTIVGQAVAIAFRTQSHLNAYRLDILGSVAGIATFALISLAWSPPLVWGVIAAVLIAVTLSHRLGRVGWVSLVGITLFLGLQSFTPGWSWSPYYRVEVLSDQEFAYISVNGIPHQATGSLESLRELDWLAAWPYRVLNDHALDRVLVVGAGNGNDVAFALDAGAKHVDAVEIDPKLLSLGGQLNPERPYDDARVATYVDDGRAFMERAAGDYDLILFALPDSLTSISGQSSLRLESYLFTREAFARAGSLLAPDGVFALYNTHSEQWVVDRMARTLHEELDSEVCQIGSTARLRVMLAGGPGLDLSCPTGERVGTFAGPTPVTDDRPFLYVRERSVPSFYLGALALVLLISVVAVRFVRGGSLPIRAYPDLFVMGVAFLLLETKSVSQFALWFGTTWSVNVLVFGGVLLSVLLAIEISRRTNPSLKLMYLLLALAIGVGWATPPELILGMPFLPRLLTACLVTYLPIFIANIVFAQRFRNTSSSTEAFGVNLLGAMVGGVLEYSTLVFGHRMLSLVVGGLYLVAFVLWRQQAAGISAAT